MEKNVDEVNFDQIRLSCGYTDNYIEFVLLVFVYMIATGALCLAITAILARLNCKHRLGYRILANFTNMAVRLTCIFLLEVLVSILVTMTVKKNQVGSEVFVATFAIISILFLIGILVISFFLGLGIGPQTQNLYASGTFWKSCFEKRQILDRVRLFKLIKRDPELV